MSKSVFKTCPDCGANLDPAEECDCKNESINKEPQVMSAEAKAARAEYYRSWRNRNPEKVKEYHRRHWDKKAKEIAFTRKKTKNSGRQDRA